MMNTKEELQAILTEYRMIEKELEYLEQKKQALREKIRSLLEGEGRTHYFLVVDNEPAILDLRQHTEVRYNEALLQQRLGPRYARILSPDLKKIRQHLQEITGSLVIRVADYWP